MPPSFLLAFDDANRAKSGYAVADRGGVEDIDDLVDVLVGVGLFLFEAGPPTSAGDDAPIGEFFLDGPSAAGSNRGPA